MPINEMLLREVHYHLENPQTPVVYFVLATLEGFDSLVKIGVSVDFERRKKEILRDLEKGNVYPDWLELGGFDQFYPLGTIRAGQNVETAIHRALKDKAMGKEWFVYDDEVAEMIDDLLDQYCACASITHEEAD